ncbi:MAG: hypothetical protein IKA82_01090 [Clostridia bacterium]|nr:hypothetical protein [Clostridia bacterium]
MIKGCQRRTVVIRGDTQSDFEFAYFIMKTEARNGKSESDIINAAGRIIAENTLQNRHERPDKRRAFSDIVKFLAGMLSGGGFVGLIWLLLSL